MATHNFPHITHQIPPLAHTPMYLWHKYWARKTWNVVAKYIKTYCPKGGIVLDPFAGSGVTAFETLKQNKRAIVCDLTSIATEITRLTILPIKPERLDEAFQSVGKKVKKKVQELYFTECRKCGKIIIFDCAIWNGQKITEIRYRACPSCDDRREANCEPNQNDLNLLKSLEKRKIKESYPTNSLYYPDGTPFKEKQQYDSIDQLFTKRNLQALAYIMEAIDSEPSDVRQFLKVGFTSMVHLCSKMVPAITSTEGSHQTPFSSTWNQHSYWSAHRFMEQNVWNKFESAISGHQGLMKAKVESNKYFESKKIAPSLKKFIAGQGDIYIHTGSCLDLMKKIPPASIDYIFTDPPYDASIQYGELCYLWESWLKKDKNYLEKILGNEIIRNEAQQKDFQVYHSLLKHSFENMFKVLKPSHYLTVTFHNPTFKIRNATIRAGVFAGFEFQKIHHQPLGQKSGKSLLQPFGSAQGDFYLRFGKPSMKVSPISLEEIDEERFEKIIVETTISLLAERAEPTPYTILINAIDPVLAKHGFFGSLKTGLDINTTLKKHLDHEFVLLPTKVGETEGMLWWFKDTKIVPHLDEVPLSERVEQTVYRQLTQKGQVSFTETWDAVSTEFPNSLTSDSTSIMAALKIYGRKVTGGYWLLKPEIQQRVNQHSEILAILALIGKKRGFNIWVGKREQPEMDCGVVHKGKRLREYMTIKKLDVDNASNQKVIENIDLIWIEGKKIKAIFEIESTTTMTSALLRGSNVDKTVDKFMVLPEERETQLRNKMSSPLFKKHFDEENWKEVYFDSLKIAYDHHKEKLDIYTIVGKKTKQQKKGESLEVQLSLF